MRTSDWELPKFEKFEFRKKSSKYCVCIPIINEGQRILTQLEKMKKVSKLADIIICDGRSNDGSTKLSVMKKYNVRTLLTKLGPGKQATQLRMGFSYALKQGYKGVIQVDGNNKDGVNAIPRFIKELDAGYDYIQGSRFVKGGKAVNTPINRYIGVRFIASPLISLFGGYLYTDITNGFRAYSARYLLHSKVLPFRSVFLQYGLNFYLAVRARQVGLLSKEIPVLRAYPKHSTPSKMKNFSDQFDLLKEVVYAAFGKYNPR
ncbi:MAG: Dolichyl-phosphate beta-D-mannosyltransferase [Candidatus Woesebacteria bacterium GW2011_GWA1_39_21]|uniref:Dolichyl-phosphate beta-D-mannosyltransferase n=1 Tax=Candidatus Woesebacteria bacterium GW2011_GWA1_39_21 TaxID=1618550 RepID=A0A0G0NCZ7_9BACT|nr:MAG: Dolichyl-phosphate beta-D-mannosyltransferase [Candidatus Woesebacteria bacterium GW2011_GWA1_39_21]